MTRTQEPHVPVRTAVLAAAALAGATGLSACSTSASGGDAIVLTATDSTCESASTDLRASWHVTSTWQVEARLANVFDRNYETVWYFNQPGRSVFLTVRYSPAAR